MHLKTLEIQGFKSFPDKIKLEFGQGITSIVGPNGSGKSNISDAVRWVMGEQSAKALRGSKMEDIIFAGTEVRKPVGFAEVSLTLDNTEKMLPIDFNEVNVTRRVYRSGESEYYINKSSCRLKDIYQLFMDTGLGKEGYSIVGQGRIDEILSTKSEDRRHVFEEAAGITKYKYRKQEAEKKLELTRQNLVRLKDIITELELQIEPLQEQSEKAKKFLNLKEELKVLEINVSLHNIEKLKNELKELEQNYQLVEAQLTENETLLKDFETEVERLYEQVKSGNTQIEQQRQDLRRDEALIQQYNNQIELLKNNIGNNEMNIQKANAEVQNIVLKITTLEKEIKAKRDLLQQLMDKKQNMENDIHSLELNHEKIFKVIEDGQQEIDGLKSELIEKMNKISEIKGKVNSIKVLEHNFEDRKKAIDKEINQNENEVQQKCRLIEELEQEFHDNKAQFEENNAMLLTYRKQAMEQKQQLEALKNEYVQRMATVKEKMSKKNLLQDMENDYEGYYKSVKNVLLQWKEGCLKHLNIHGPLSQLIKVPPKFVTAIETVLGAAMQNIVVHNEQDAKQAIQFLKQKRLGRATFLPISSVKGTLIQDAQSIQNFPGCIGIGAQLIEFNDMYRQIIYSLLGRVVVVENIDVGIKMAQKFGYKFRIVTLEGDILNAGGSMTGGSVNKSSGFLSRSNDIKRLQKEISDLKCLLTKIKDDVSNKEAALQLVAIKIDETEKSEKELENINIKLESNISHNKSFYKDLLTAKEELLKEKNQVTEQIDNIANEIEQLSNTITILEQSIHEIEQCIEQKHHAYEGELEEKNRLMQAISDKKMDLHSVEKDIELCKERIETIQNEISTYQKEKVDKENDSLVLMEANKKVEGEIKEKESQTCILQENCKLIQNTIATTIEQQQKLDLSIKDRQEQIKEKRNTISIVQQECRKIENRKIRMDLELENTINKLWDEYEQTFTTALAYKEEIDDFSNVNKTINQLRADIKGLGNVNVNAIEEYKTVKERYEFLSGQRNDLEEAERSLARIIADMLKLMDKQFAEQFKIINENFNLVFNELFGGGRATLRLSEPDNVLESGIEIEVQPPGKKLQNLMLLSGGEKAFTAIALLFAILKVRPTPFCILDEIEAALDDANVYRFAEYLKRFSEQTQFIIVTHRRGTMECADVLYGVTMQEKGVSKLLSLKLEEIAS